MMYDLARFAAAQRRDFETALFEIRAGKKQSHWMWYIFPQLKGLGRSSTSEFYGIQGPEEAKAFLADPYLGGNLRTICEALLELDTDNARYVFGSPDDKKLCSSMTLFARVSGAEDLFARVLEKFYGGHEDKKTLQMLGL